MLDTYFDRLSERLAAGQAHTVVGYLSEAPDLAGIVDNWLLSESSYEDLMKAIYNEYY